jgi:hypothetical protein
MFHSFLESGEERAGSSRPVIAVPTNFGDLFSQKLTSEPCLPFIKREAALEVCQTIARCHCPPCALAIIASESIGWLANTHEDDR